ncbi:MAG: site-2 protease family protein [Actinobacteria bacterium]|nr:site-2 protease family protein [Actinomycetota bacterium]
MNPDWGQVALVVAVLVPSVILHEVSHGVVALWYGDDTAKQAGRLTLNPLPHIDPFGTIILPVLLSLGGLGAFGYAKPVPVQPNRLRDPRQHSLYVSLVGPAVNIVLAALAVLVYRTFFEVFRSGGGILLDPSLAARVVFFFGLINVILAVFNLLPIPPLDGSAMVERVLPERWWPMWLRLRQWSMGILLLLVLALPGALTSIFRPVIQLYARLL